MNTSARRRPSSTKISSQQHIWWKSYSIITTPSIRLSQTGESKTQALHSANSPDKAVKNSKNPKGTPKDWRLRWQITLLQQPEHWRSKQSIFPPNTDVCRYLGCARWVLDRIFPSTTESSFAIWYLNSQCRHSVSMRTRVPGLNV